MEQGIVGPRVLVDRDGTADRGGGQLVLKQDGLFVRTRGFERLLGAAGAIDHVQLLDLNRLRAQVYLVDGRIWNVESEGEDLTAFFRQLQSAAGRPGLLRDPPRISELVRGAATPARIRTACWIALALIAFVPLRWLGALARPVGLVLAVLGLIALLLGAAALARRGRDAPALLRSVRPWVSLPVLALALIASVAGSIGFSDAAARAAMQDEQTRARAEAAQQAQQTAARKQAAARARRAEADALAAQMLQALNDQRLRDAQALRDRIEALVPGHEVAKKVGPGLERALLDLDERERTKGVARAIARARALAKDRDACETAKVVADAYALLRRARPSDANYDAAGGALERLESCRKRIRARFAQSAEESRHRMRVLAATQTEAAIRRLGYPVKVSLSGRAANVMRIEARELNAAAMPRILALIDDPTFETARTEEGFARIELRGESVARERQLKPLPAAALVGPVLEPFGLAKPLTLPSTTQASP